MKYNSSLLENSNIGELIRKSETDFTSGTTKVSKYVDMSLYEDINKTYAYLDSKHISGETDTQGRDKPFFNIVLSTRNIWYRATDIDRSNIKIRSTKNTDDVGAFLGTIHLQDWMRKENFGQFLNNWGINSAGFNESVVKFVEKDGRLIPSVVPWNRIICDQVDFASNPKVEILELTEAQLRQNKSYDQDLVEKLCNALTARELVDGNDKDNKNNYVKLYEIHGELPLSYLTGDPDDRDEFVQQMHVVSFVVSSEKGRHDDYTLYSGKEAKDPYMLTALLPEIDGSIALKGSVKTQFDVQWMQNHSVKAIKDQLDLASKLVFQTSDATFVGQNALSSIQNGDILIHKPNEPLTHLANNSQDITSLQNFSAQWKSLGNEIAGISEQMLGETPKSGTAWRQTEALLQESHSLFQLMTENKGLAIEQMLRQFVIPYLKKQMGNSKQISAELKAHEITRLDEKYIKNYANREANKQLKERILSGESVTRTEQAELTASQEELASSSLESQGNKRYFAPSEISDTQWKEVFKDLEWDVEVDVTNESLDQNALTTIGTMMSILAKNPMALDDPRMQMLWNKALQLTGAVSTIELASVPKPKPQPEQVVPGNQSINLQPNGNQTVQ